MDGSQLTLDFDVEEWRPVVGWPDYEVSSYGRVRRGPPTYFTCPKNGLVYERIKAGTLLFGSIKPRTGYHSVTLRSPDGRKVDVNIHALVCRAFHGPAPTPKHEVAHGDGNRTNNFYKNLRWATHRENGADMAGHGRTLRGTKHHFNKLSEEDVHLIRARFDRGENASALAREFGVSKVTGQRVASRQSWRWLPER